MGYNTTLLYMVLVIGLVSAGVSAFVIAIYADSGKTIDPQYEQDFNKLSESQALYEKNQEIIESGEINTLGFGIAIFKNLIIGAKSLMQSSVIFIKMLWSTSKYLQISISIIGGLVGIIIISSIVGFYKYVSGGRAP